MLCSCSNGGETCATTGECCPPSNPLVPNNCQIPTGSDTGVCGTVRCSAAAPGASCGKIRPALVAPLATLLSALLNMSFHRLHALQCGATNIKCGNTADCCQTPATQVCEFSSSAPSSTGACKTCIAPTLFGCAFSSDCCGAAECRQGQCM